MISRVFERLGPDTRADGLWRRVEHTGVSFEAGRLKAAGAGEEAGINLRVLREGRVGFAGSTAVNEQDLRSVVTRALESAEIGEPLELAFPGPAPLSSIMIFDALAAAAPLARLVEIGQGVVERLHRDGRQVNVGVQREIGECTVGNTAGASGTYAFTRVAVSADVTRVGGDDVLMVYDVYHAAGLPDAAELNALVESIETRLALAQTIAEPPEGALPVVFTPAGLGVILLPLEMALSGKTVLQGISPLAGKTGDRVFDERFSIIDDPCAPGRPGSRPLDDEGVASRRLPLVQGGTVREFVYDLETAARAATRSTGHGERGIFGKPGIGYSNLIVEDGASDVQRAGGNVQRVSGDGPRLGGGLLDGIEDGLLVDDLIGVGQGNVISGAFSHPVGLAYRVRHGEIVGRVKNAAVAGDVYELLKRVGGFGNDGRWLGARWSPSVLLEGVSVARR